MRRRLSRIPVDSDVPRSMASGRRERALSMTADQAFQRARLIIKDKWSSDKTFIKKMSLFFLVVCLVTCTVHMLLSHGRKITYFKDKLQTEGLAKVSHLIHNEGVTTLVELALYHRKHSESKGTGGDLDTLREVSLRVYRDEALRQALIEYSIEDYLPQLRTAYNVKQLSDLLAKREAIHSDALSDRTFTRVERLRASSKLNRLVQYLKQHKDGELVFWQNFYQKETSIRYGNAVLLSLVIALAITLLETTFRQKNVAPGIDTTTCSFHKYFSYKYWVTAEVVCDWTDLTSVGNTVSFIVKFTYAMVWTPYPISDQDDLKVKIVHQSSGFVASHNIEHGTTEANLAKVNFNVRRSGAYEVSVNYNGRPVNGSPFTKEFISGPVDPPSSRLILESSTLLCAEGCENSILLEVRDRFDNLCSLQAVEDSEHTYHITVTQSGSDEPVDIFQRFTYDPHSYRVGGQIRLDRTGFYQAEFLCDGQLVKNGRFSLVILAENDANAVKETTSKKKYNKWYEARLVSVGGRQQDKPKKVYCYVSPKQLTIKEYYMKIIPKRLYTYRVCPSTKFAFDGHNNKYDAALFSIDDSCQATVQLASKDCGLVVATFTNYLLKNIGGSETFKDKQDFFYSEVRKLHEKTSHKSLLLTVRRSSLLESSMKAVRSFGPSDWCRNLTLTFKGEEGLDWGGVRREWFEVVCRELFEPSKSGLFRSFKDNNQGLVHPNPRRPTDLKLKYYEFAGRIVGKCLYESSLGGSYRQSIPAKFSRSFLAQLIGLRVTYKYFEQDDPDLYMSKIQYIRENDVNDMEIVFAEEEYNKQGQVERVVDLVPNGRNKVVNNDNKFQYLDCLAQYRLSTSVQSEVEAFLKGLNDLIPDNLLSIFDENELELLMCGTGSYDLADFKANHAVVNVTFGFNKILDWFWMVVGNFTQEEMAKLLQFTTGSSQLPPGGFGDLTPKFQIAPCHTHGSLPTAHTCFNQLCLPTYDSVNDFHRALVLAINEGNQGFGMI